MVNFLSMLFNPHDYHCADYATYTFKMNKNISTDTTIQGRLDMMRKPQNDLRYIKTEKLIQNTFYAMLQEMDYSQVTVKELTNRAMINRKTFYLHYNSLDELLGRLQADIYAQVLESTSDVRLPRDLEKLIREFFLFCTQKDEITEKVICSQGNFSVGQSPADYVMKSMFHYSAPGNSHSSPDQSENNMIDAYLRGSIIFIYSQWVADGRKIPLERLIELTTWLISQGISKLP